MELNNQPVHNLCQGRHGPLQKPATFTDLHFQPPYLVGTWWFWTVPSVVEMAESCLFRTLTKAAPMGVRASLDIAAEVYKCDLTHRQPSLPWPPRGGWRALCSHHFLKRYKKGPWPKLYCTLTGQVACEQKISISRKNASAHVTSESHP